MENHSDCSQGHVVSSCSLLDDSWVEVDGQDTIDSRPATPSNDIDHILEECTASLARSISSEAPAPFPPQSKTFAYDTCYIDCDNINEEQYLLDEDAVATTTMITGSDPETTYTTTTTAAAAAPINVLPFVTPESCNTNVDNIATAAERKKETPAAMNIFFIDNITTDSTSNDVSSNETAHTMTMFSETPTVIGRVGRHLSSPPHGAEGLSSIDLFHFRLMDIPMISSSNVPPVVSSTAVPSTLVVPTPDRPFRIPESILTTPSDSRSCGAGASINIEDKNSILEEMSSDSKLSLAGDELWDWSTRDGGNQDGYDQSRVVSLGASYCTDSSGTINEVVEAGDKGSDDWLVCSTSSANSRCAATGLHAAKRAATPGGLPDVHKFKTALTATSLEAASRASWLATGACARCSGSAGVVAVGNSGRQFPQKRRRHLVLLSYFFTLALGFFLGDRWRHSRSIAAAAAAASPAASTLVFVRS